MYTSYEQCMAALIASSEADFKGFSGRIVNSEYPLLGVRIPVIRRVAKQVKNVYRDGVLQEFYAEREHTFESVMLAGLIASNGGDYESTRTQLKRIIPLFGSWAHTDTVIPTACRAVGAERLMTDFAYLEASERTFDVRAYVIMLFGMTDDAHIDVTLKKIKGIRSGEYYIDMAVAWLIAECLVKQYKKTLPILEGKTLNRFVHNKAIQKARESFRISDERKQYLKTLKL